MTSLGIFLLCRNITPKKVYFAQKEVWFRQHFLIFAQHISKKTHFFPVFSKFGTLFSPNFPKKTSTHLVSVVHRFTRRNSTETYRPGYIFAKGGEKYSTIHPPWDQPRDLSGKSRSKSGKGGKILEGLLENFHGPRMVEYFSPSTEWKNEYRSMANISISL